MSDDTRRIIGDFTIVRRGEDLIREAFLAQSKSGDEVALALFDMDAATQRDVLEELERAKQLKHPVAARIITAFEHKGRCAVAFEYVEGITLGTLATHLRQEGEPLAEGAALYIIKTVLDALTEAHKLSGGAGKGPLVHWHLGPEQILVTWDAEVKVYGLGMSAAYRIERELMPWPPEILPYVPPEVRAGGEPKPLSNLYSAAAILWSLLTHEEPPADGKPIPPLAERREGVDEALAEAVDRALSPNPSSRFLAARLLAQCVDSRVTQADQEELRWNMEVLRAVLAIDSLACLAGMPVSYLTEDTARQLGTIPPGSVRAPTGRHRPGSLGLAPMKSPPMPRVAPPRLAPPPSSTGPTQLMDRQAPRPGSGGPPVDEEPSAGRAGGGTTTSRYKRTPPVPGGSPKGGPVVKAFPEDPLPLESVEPPASSVPKASWDVITERPATSDAPPSVPSSPSPFDSHPASDEPGPPSGASPLPLSSDPPFAAPTISSAPAPAPTSAPELGSVPAPAKGYTANTVTLIAGVVAVVAFGVGVIVSKVSSGSGSDSQPPAASQAPATTASQPASPKPTVAPAPPTATPTVSAAAAPSTEPSAAPSESAAPTADPAALPKDEGYLVVEPAREGVGVYETGKYVGPTGSPIRLKCGTRFIRLGDNPRVQWLSEGRGVPVACQAITKATFELLKSKD
ncbi:MAG: protein kinase [Deltaproteobacteria bacterium]|nr:protein kinase [Deltaproteobacteria bacterium]